MTSRERMLTALNNGRPDRLPCQVQGCERFEATRDHAGYIVRPSDHFFHGDPACLHDFAAAARECRY